MMEAVRTSETSVDNHFTRQYNPEDSSEQEHYLTAETSVTMLEVHLQVVVSRNGLKCTRYNPSEPYRVL
jgi:hypothetical protein